jgi:hypothetical protein
VVRNIFLLVCTSVCLYVSLHVCPSDISVIVRPYIPHLLVKEVGKLVTLALHILRACCPRQLLPLASSQHCVIFEMPCQPPTDSLIRSTFSLETEEISPELLEEGKMNGEMNEQHLGCERSCAEEYEIVKGK